MLKTEKILVDPGYQSEDENESSWDPTFYTCYNEHPFARIECDELYLGSLRVVDYNKFKFKPKIPMLYCVREADTKSFVAGLDLLENGCIYMSLGERDGYSNIEEAIDFAEKDCGCKCAIYLEDPM